MTRTLLLSPCTDCGKPFYSYFSVDGVESYYLQQTPARRVEKELAESEMAEGEMETGLVRTSSTERACSQVHMFSVASKHCPF